MLWAKKNVTRKHLYTNWHHVYAADLQTCYFLTLSIYKCACVCVCARLYICWLGALCIYYYGWIYYIYSCTHAHTFSILFLFLFIFPLLYFHSFRWLNDDDDCDDDDDYYAVLCIYFILFAHFSYFWLFGGLAAHVICRRRRRIEMKWFSAQKYARRIAVSHRRCSPSQKIVFG